MYIYVGWFITANGIPQFYISFNKGIERLIFYSSWTNSFLSFNFYEDNSQGSISGFLSTVLFIFNASWVMSVCEIYFSYLNITEFSGKNRPIFYFASNSYLSFIVYYLPASKLAILFALPKIIVITIPLNNLKKFFNWLSWLFWEFYLWNLKSFYYFSWKISISFG